MKKKNLIRLKDITFGTIAVSSLFLLLGASGAFAATSAVDEVTITVPASCSLTNTVGSQHAATIETGVYQENIGETTFKVFCNDSEGFSVYAVGYTNDYSGDNTLRPATVEAFNAITTGTATSGDTSNWAMKLSAVAGDYAPTLEAGFNVYHAVPAEYTKVASFASNTDATAGSSFKSTYAAYISQTQVADSYSGKVKYTVVHPASESPLISSINQLTYMQDFKGLSATEMESVLDSMQDSTTYNLIDNRDNRTYQIAKMKDGNVWMAENLDLGRTALTNDLTNDNTNMTGTITANTFNSWKKTQGTHSKETGEYMLIDGIDGTSNTPFGTLYNYYAVSAGTVSGNNNIYDTISDICPAGWRLPTGGATGELNDLYSTNDYNTYQAMRAPISSGGAAFVLAGYFYTNTSNLNSYGYYWSSTRVDASNNSMLFLNNSSSIVKSASTSAREYGRSVRCIVKRPVSALTISYGTGISNVKVNGITVQNGGMIILEEGMPYPVIAYPSADYGFNSWSLTSAGNIDNNNWQFITYTPVRGSAILSATSTYVSTVMQNLSSESCTSTPLRVKDSRDGYVYTIQRLADGNCWMMNNLDLGRTNLSVDLTSTNTNTDKSITAATFNSWKKTTPPSYTDGYYTGEYTSIEGGDSVAGVIYGTLYNYYSVSAGSGVGKYDEKNDPLYDICPAGWRLPTGGSNGELYALYTAYNSYDNMRASVEDGGAAFALAGEYGYHVSTYPSYAPRYQGSNGNYWSSSLSSSYSSGYYYQYLQDSNKSVNYSSNDILEYSARCIMKDPSLVHSATVVYGEGISNVTINEMSVANGGKVTLQEGYNYRITVYPNANYAVSSITSASGTLSLTNYTRASRYSIGNSDDTITISSTYISKEMQNLASTDCATTASSVKDNRDNQVYTIQRLADGNCWMMDNLNLGATSLSTDLTSSNTNITNTITASNFNGWKKTSSVKTRSRNVYMSYNGADATSGTLYGTVYNFRAAFNTDSYNKDGRTMAEDICPAGWSVPTEYKINLLMNAYNTNATIRAPISNGGAAVALSGIVTSGGGDNPIYAYGDDTGRYWTSSPGSLYEARVYFYVSSGSAGSISDRGEPDNFNYIRCVLK